MLSRIALWVISASLFSLVPFDAARSAEFTFSSDSGAILKLQRSPDLALNGSICAPSDGGGCETLAVTGVNRPGILSLQIQGGEQADKIIEYDRLLGGKSKSLEGYAVWTTTSPDAPDYLRTFRAPVVKSDPLSDASLAAWNGDTSKLIDLNTYSLSIQAFDRFVESRGYPQRPAATTSLVTSRQDAASWEALSIRETGLVPDISTFRTDTDGAVVALDSKVIMASLSKESELAPYLSLNDVGAPRAGARVIDLNMFTINAPVASVFDAYVNPSDRQSATKTINDALAKHIPQDECLVTLGSSSYFPIECVTHTKNYNKKSDGIFVSCLFAFIINEPVNGSRNIVVTQQAVGGVGAIDQGPPPGDQFTIYPTTNASVLSVEKQLRMRLGQVFSIAFPGMDVRQ